MKNFIGAVDLTQKPDIYRTSNRKHYGRLCIDFQPPSVPTIASFATIGEAKQWLVTMFGAERVQEWFPDGIRELVAN